MMNLLWPPAMVPPRLGAGEAHIWAVPIDESTRATDLRKLLSADEQARADRFRFEAPAKRFVAARAALRILLGHYLHHHPDEIQFATTGNNKPRLASKHGDADLRFNVSHSGALAIVAITTEHEIGIDLEQLREVRHADQLASRYFHQNEIATITSSTAADRSTAFLNCWTGKEAVLKAIGIGVTSTLDSFDVPVDGSEACIEMPADDTSREALRIWLTRLVPHRDYLSAVAVLSARRQFVCHAFAAD
jgi:4'-phosphopantetheinyl transferase